MLGDGTVLSDLTEDTVTEDTLLKDVTAYNKKGAKIIGRMVDVSFPATPSAGSTPVVMNNNMYRVSKYSSTVASTGIRVTVPKTGRYTCTYIVSDGYSGTRTAQLYVNGTSQGKAHNVSSSQRSVVINDILSLSAGDVVEIYFKPAGNALVPTGSCGRLALCIDWYNGLTDPDEIS